jgi:hypothetical protein
MATEEWPLNERLQQQKDQKEELARKRKAVRSFYKVPEAQPALEDLAEFIQSQIQGCIDRAAVTDNKTIEDKSLHMMLMADIIKTYLDTQMNAQ